MLAEAKAVFEFVAASVAYFEGLVVDFHIIRWARGKLDGAFLIARRIGDEAVAVGGLFNGSEEFNFVRA